jgi:hypothetical protein
MYSAGEACLYMHAGPIQRSTSYSGAAKLRKHSVQFESVPQALRPRRGVPNAALLVRPCRYTPTPWFADDRKLRNSTHERT